MILETQLASLIDRQSFAKICWDIWRAPQQAHGDPAPLSASGLIRGRRLVSYQFIVELV